ncbi:MAG TPA: hypothetical protein VNA20_13125 [Frankiaceae bacterium]|nr:hypothetical protein [Frankiaceae bacterium]
MPSPTSGAFAAAALLVAGFAPAATAHHAPTVAGETVIVAQRTAKMRVYVPKAALLAIDPRQSFSVEGPGRLVGVILRESHPEAPEEAGFLRLPSWGTGRVYGWGPGGVVHCESATPEPVPPVHSDCTKGKAPTHYDLRRGTYTLIALTYGAPVRITLRFANLPGETTLTPATAVPYGVAPMKPTVAQPVTWSGGASVRTTARSAYLFGYNAWQQDESAAGSVGSCWYSDESAGAPEYQWLPGCPTGSSGALTEVRHPVYGSWGPAMGGHRAMLSTAMAGAPGTVGAGAWAVAQNVRDASGFVYWVGI